VRLDAQYLNKNNEHYAVFGQARTKETTCVFMTPKRRMEYMHND